MKWDDVKAVIGKVAPLVGTAIGGPFGGIAGAAIKAALGVKDDDAAIEALKSDPQAVLKLKEAELQFKQFMRDADLREEDIAAKDRASARELFKVNMWPQITLSTVYNIGYFALLFMFIDLMTSVDAPTLDEWVKGTIGTLIGILTAAIPQINSFWFGSSTGSKEKTAALST